MTKNTLSLEERNARYVAAIDELNSRYFPAPVIRLTPEKQVEWLAALSALTASHFPISAN